MTQADLCVMEAHERRLRTLGVEFCMKLLLWTWATAPAVIIRAPARLPLFRKNLQDPGRSIDEA